MGKERQSSKRIREFILRNLIAHQDDIASFTASKFRITRQAVNRHLKHLESNGLISSAGSTRLKTYDFVPIKSEELNFDVSPELREDAVWRESISPLLTELRENVLGICYYGTTEMINNVIDHSESTDLFVRLWETSGTVEIQILDNGAGIFDKIRRELDLPDARTSILELAKGKLTTDPEKHTGEGIFFTSRMFDRFAIHSGSLSFGRYRSSDWLIEDQGDRVEGTYISMTISKYAEHTTKSVFDKYAPEHDDFGFTRTHVVVLLAQYEGETLVSRSQAKRLLSRLEQFREVFLDFEGVETIGPAFADEIFRVYQNGHPDTQIVGINANADVTSMILRARGGKDKPGPLD